MLTKSYYLLKGKNSRNLLWWLTGQEEQVGSPQCEARHKEFNSYVPELICEA